MKNQKDIKEQNVFKQINIIIIQGFFFFNKN